MKSGTIEFVTIPKDEYDRLVNENQKQKVELDDLRKRLEDAEGMAEHWKDTRQDPYDFIERLEAENRNLQKALQVAMYLNMDKNTGK